MVEITSFQIEPFSFCSGAINLFWIEYCYIVMSCLLVNVAHFDISSIKKKILTQKSISASFGQKVDSNFLHL